MKTNQSETARPVIVRFNTGAEDSGFFSGNRQPDIAVLNASTERPSLANFQILPPKQAEVFGSPTECYIFKENYFTLTAYLATKIN